MSCSRRNVIWMSTTARGWRPKSTRRVSCISKSVLKRTIATGADPKLPPCTYISEPADGISGVKSPKTTAKRSLLDGWHIAVKDNICTTDLPTTCGSSMLQDFVSPFDATVIRKIRDHGGIIAGKTNMDEFGMGSHSIHSAFGEVYNPAVKEGQGPYSAGGSSGGSAAALMEAGRVVDAALGTDTGGSVRLPASFCGVHGLKPSYGQVSRYGVVAYANSLDTVGILAHRLQSLRKLYHIVAGPDENDPTCLTVESRQRIAEATQQAETHRAKRPCRVGIPIEYLVGRNGKYVDTEVMTEWQLVVEALSANEELDCEVVPVSLPSTRLALPAYYILAPAEASSNLAKFDSVRYGSPSDTRRAREDVLYANTRHTRLGIEVRRRILLGAYSLSSSAIDNYFIQAQKVRRLVQQDFNNVFAMPHPLLNTDNQIANTEGVDLLLTPTAPTRAPLLSDVRKMDPVNSCAYDVFTVPASLAGLPAISIAARGSFDVAGLPIGLQVIGQYGDDDFLLNFATKIEELNIRMTETEP